METEQLNIKIGTKEMQRIRQFATATRRTKTAVVLMALEKFFDEQNKKRAKDV